jgi:hypothetical protein
VPTSGLIALAVAVTGLHGVVFRGPTAPVCRVGTPCSAPAPGAVLLFERAGHAAVRVRAKAGGRYSVRLAPGTYRVLVAHRPRVGGGIRPLRVHVSPGVWRKVDFTIDTGIR